MKKIFSNKSRLVMIAAVCIAVIIGVTGVILAGRAGIFTNIINTVTTPVKTLVTGIAVKTEELYDYMYGFDELKAENELLKKQIAEMESEIRDATALTEEKTDTVNTFSEEKIREMEEFFNQFNSDSYE